VLSRVHESDEGFAFQFATTGGGDSIRMGVFFRLINFNDSPICLSRYSIMYAASLIFF